MTPTFQPGGVLRPVTLPVALLMSLVASSAMAQAHFAPSVNYGVGITPNSIASGYFNGDGFIDLVTSNPADPTGAGADLSILLGNGDGTFAPAASINSGGVQPTFVVAGHFNPGPTLDLAMVYLGTPNNGVAILLGNGDGTFGLPTTIANSPDLRRLAVGDFNGDGRDDLAATDYFGSRILIRLADGTGGFNSPSDVILAFGSTPLSIVAGNFDAGGNLDLAVVTSSSVSVLLGNGSGGFGHAPGSPIALGATPSFIASGYFNADGFLDLAATGFSAGNVYVLLGSSTGSFSPGPGSPIFLGSLPGPIAVADYDGDTRVDLAVHLLGAGVTSILGGDGLGGFVVEGSFGNGAEAMLAADFNGDSKPDLASANYGGNSVSVLLNSTQDTTTTLSSSPNPSVFGTSVTFTATVTGPFPSGTMTFKADGVNIPDCGAGGVVTFTGSTATCATISLSPGLRVITVEFVGNAPYNNSNATLTGGQSVITLVPTTTSVVSSSRPLVQPASVTFTATVTGSSPTGTVDFSSSLDGTLCSAVPLSAGVALCTTPLTLGTHVIAADYSGDGTNALSSGTLAGGQSVIAGTPFGNAGTYALADAHTLVAGDFDTVGLGHVGLAVTQPGSNQISTLYGNGNGTFNTMAPILLGNGPTALAVADFDATGDFSSDLAVGNFASNDVYVVPSDGLGNFPLSNGPYAAGTGPTAAVAAAFDGNGPGLAVANKSSDNVTIFLNDTTGVLTSHRTHLVGNSPVAIATGDFNGDPFPDLVVVNEIDNTITVMLLNSDSDPLVPFSTYAVGASPSAVAVGDVDGNGTLDIVVTNKTNDTVSLLLGDGLGSFTPGGVFPVGDGPESVALADFNGDTFLDLAVANGLSDNVSLLYGDGAGSFSAPVNIGLNPGSHPISIVAADFNGNKPDLAVATNVGVTILLNSVFPPTPPTGLSVSIGTGDAKISFTPGILGDGSPAPTSYEATCNPGAITASITVFPPNSITIPGLTAGTTYTCSIRAYNMVGPGPASATVTFTMPVPTTTSLTSSRNPSTPGAMVTFTVTVTGLGPTGMVEFYDDISGPLCVGVPLSAGVAQCSVNTLTLGPHLITADYLGDLSNDPSNGILPGGQSVVPAAATFGNAGTYFLPGATMLVKGDLDFFGNVDLAVTQPGSNQVSSLYGFGDGTFSAFATIPVLDGPTALAVADFNGDGSGDLAAGNFLSNDASVLLSDGFGNFPGSTGPYATGSGPTAAVAAAFDGNGQGLAVVNKTDDTVSIFVNDGNSTGVLLPKITLPTGNAPVAIATGNLNGDANPDLVVANEDDDTVSVLLLNGDSQLLVDPSATYPVGDAPSSVTLADVNGDSFLDIIVTNEGSDNVTVLLGDGTGAFLPGVSFPAGDGPESVAVGDFNGDTLLDLAVANGLSDNVSILLGDGLGSFAASSNIPLNPATHPNSIVADDFNGDGRTDLAVATSDGVTILLNGIAPPDAPTGLSATPGNGQVTISFTPPADGGAPIQYYQATCNPGGIVAYAYPPDTSVTITGLTNGTTYTCSITAVNLLGPGPASATVDETPNLSCPPITLGSLFNGILGAPFAGSVGAAGGVGPYTYGVTSGSLPPTLSLTGSGVGAGDVAGTPTATGTFNFDITATDANTCTGARSYTMHIGTDVAAGDLVIREFRWRGPAGENDEYVKVFNKTASEATIAATDGSPGYAIVAERTAPSALPSLLVVIPNGTKIKPGGFFLAANNAGYSLKDYGGTDAALPDATWGAGTNVFDNSGVGLFRSTSAIDVPSRIDGVGFSGSLAEYKEGTGLGLPGGSIVDGEFSFARKAPYPAGIVQDTGSNSADFLFVSTNAGIYNLVQSALGTPGPQNRTTLTSRVLPHERVNLAVSTDLPPNRVQVGNYHYFRRKVTNNTGAPITKLRLRVAAITTLFGVGYNPGVQADWRGITSPDAVLNLPGPLTVTAKGLTLEAPSVAYSATGKGAGYNASFTVDLSDIGGSLANGASIYLNIGFRNVKGGSFNWVLVPEFMN